MKHYLTEETCRLEKKYYTVLLRVVQDWEEAFWNEERPEQSTLTFSAKVYAGIFLFRAIDPIAASTLEALFRRELAQANPILAWNAELATQEIREKAEASLAEKLEADPELLFRTAPLLKEQLERCVRQFSEMLSEMLCRIHADRQELSAAFFGGNDLGAILKIDGGQGDAHQNGRSACIITAEAGRFLYKPREMKADVLLYGMAAEHFSDTVLLPKALDHGSYGYAQFMETAPAENEADARLFFHRLGGVCALFHAFASTDFHCENILAQGSWPVLVDLETFLGLPSPAWRSAAETMDPDPFAKDFQQSLFFSSVLPRLADGQEFSPLLCKDEHSILPLLNGQRVDVRSALPEFEAGFCKIYDRCVEQRPALLAWLARFSGCQLRALLRNTNDYAKLLQGLNSSKALSDPAYRAKLVQMLQNGLSTATQESIKEQTAAVGRSEMQALLRGDVPIFHCRTDSVDLYADGQCIVSGYLSRTPLAHVQERLGALSPAEREFELHIIRQALRCAHILREPVQEAAPAVQTEVSFPKEAAEIFEALWANRVVSPSGGPGWMDHRNDSNSFGYLPITYGMGEGGIAAFAAEYAQVTKDPRAVQILHDFREKVLRAEKGMQVRGSTEPVGGMQGITGLSGCVKALLMAGRALEDKTFVQTAVSAAGLLCSVPADSITVCDFYGGAAGLLYLLCTAPELRAMPDHRQRTEALCQRLLALQTLETKQGIRTWDTLGKKRPLSGLGHGIAGIGLALAAAWHLYPSERLYTAVQDAFLLERQLYNETMGTWPDFRDSAVPSSYMNGYCSGAPGMGSVYLRLHQLGIPDFDEELEKAIRKVVETPLMPRDHYCCGNSATVEFLLDAGRVLNRPELAENARERLTAMVERKAANGQFTFLPDQYENYSPFGMLNGLSGIGHVLMKAAGLVTGSLFFEI
ncbi:MAG: type 2 lanthipeptide synthetase LanM family protein [Faecalibacterium sp.]